MQHLPALIIDLALILGFAALTSIFFKWIKQPVVLGYLLAGLLVGPNFDLFPTVAEQEGIKLWAEIGVIFLLFGLGLEFSFKKLVRMGGVAALTAIIEVSLTMLIGYIVAKSLGWQEMDCLFFGGILAIASTTIIIRSFDELGVKTQNFAGLVTGILIIEDLVAVILMVVLSTVSVSRSFEGVEMILSIVKLIFFLILWFVSGIYFLPSLLKAGRRFLSEETLLILSVALCLLMVVLAHEAGFSPALGAFIMGSILAETNKAEKIEHLIKPLQNVFGAVFFVSVGMLIDIGVIVEYIVPVLLGVFTLLFAKPFFVTIGSTISGQPLKTSIQAGMSLSQIGEFSFIIASLGLSLGVIGEQLYPIAVAISVLTTFTTPFMIRLSTPFHAYVEKVMPNRWLQAIIRYGSGANKAAETSQWKKFVRLNVIDILVFSVIITFVIVFANRYFPLLLDDKQWNHVISVAITLVVISPFLWALMFRGTRLKDLQKRHVSSFLREPLLLVLLIRIAIGLFFIGFLFNTFVSPLFAFSGVVLSIVFLVAFRKKIQSLYLRIEGRFVSNLNERERNEQQKLLSPWDSHMTTIELHPALSCLGKPLSELQLRERFGINVAVIKRGEMVINVPSRTESLYPNDKLTIIGTDEDLLAFKAFVEDEVKNRLEPHVDHEVSLHHITLTEKSELVNKTIRESAIRERTRGLVVGVEREGNRILNPESDLELKLNDTIWLVGDEKRIQVFFKNQL